MVILTSRRLRNVKWRLSSWAVGTLRRFPDRRPRRTGDLIKGGVRSRVKREVVERLQRFTLGPIAPIIETAHPAERTAFLRSGMGSLSARRMPAVLLETRVDSGRDSVHSRSITLSYMVGKALVRYVATCEPPALPCWASTSPPTSGCSNRSAACIRTLPRCSIGSIPSAVPDTPSGNPFCAPVTGWSRHG